MIDALRNRRIEGVAGLGEAIFQAGTSEVKNWVPVAGAMADLGYPPTVDRLRAVLPLSPDRQRDGVRVLAGVRRANQIPPALEGGEGRVRWVSKDGKVAPLRHTSPSDR